MWKYIIAVKTSFVVYCGVTFLIILSQLLELYG